MKKIVQLLLIVNLLIVSSCNDYMDIVPDNIAELDQAFSMRASAEKFLFTCYSWIPRGYDLQSNPALLSADEMWLNSTSNFSPSDWPAWYIAMGGQNTNSPLLN